MTGAAFVLRGLRFHRTSYLGVLAGAALGAMVLLGALLAGDSVQATLRQLAEARLGRVDAVLLGGDRLFRAALADELAAEGVAAAPVMMVKATVSVPRTGRALGSVQVLGVDRRFWQLGPGGGQAAPPQGHGLFVNEPLAHSLDLGPNETLVLRFDKPALIASDAPVAGKAADLIALRGELEKICGDEDFGRFSLDTSQQPQATVWVPLERLQEAVGFAGKANLLLLHDDPKKNRTPLPDRIARRCALEDYGLTVEDVPLARAVEVRSARIFFDRQVAAAIRQRFPAAQPVITYLANTIAANGKSTPYSMVTAVGPEAAPFLPAGGNGVVLNAWEAADLGAKVGDPVRIDYYALAAGNRLVERSATLPVANVTPLTGLAADPRWMPDFPGVAAAEHAADWDPGVPVDLKRIRAQDEAYWDAHRGTPKLFLPLETGRKLFGNRWGEFTALRVPAAAATRAEVAAGLLGALTPATAGLVVREVGAPGRAAAASPVDFAGLFLGMSVFLMAAAVALTAMLFRFHIEARNRESGLLAALGIPAGKILRWRLLEGLCVVTAGCAIGALLAAGYTRWLLGWLASIWSGAGGRSLFHFHLEPATLLAGSAGFVALMMAVIWQVTRRQARRAASLRLEAGAEEVERVPAKLESGSEVDAAKGAIHGGGRNARATVARAFCPEPGMTQPGAARTGPAAAWWAAGFAAGGLGALGATGPLGRQGAFFLAGFAFLLAGLAGYRWVLRRRAAAGGGELSPRRLAELNCGRRAARSLLVTGTLASGVFL
ncbi:MAG: FtsX-like permease family protein, partial [Verrucomicrobiota bacterium]